MGRLADKKKPLPHWITNLWLGWRWGCRISLGARIQYPFALKIGRGTRLGHCRISADPITQGNMPASGFRIELGERCMIRDGVLILGHGGPVHIGNRVSINEYSIINAHGGVVIGDETRVAAHAAIIAENHVIDDPDHSIREGLVGRGIHIGRDVWLGNGVKVLDGVEIGDRTVLGAGAVATRSIGPGLLAAGVPARVLRSRFASEEAKGTTV